MVRTRSGKHYGDSPPLTTKNCAICSVCIKDFSVLLHVLLHRQSTNRVVKSDDFMKLVMSLKPLIEHQTTCAHVDTPHGGLRGLCQAIIDKLNVAKQTRQPIRDWCDRQIDCLEKMKMHMDHPPNTQHTQHT